MPDNRDFGIQKLPKTETNPPYPSHQPMQRPAVIIPSQVHHQPQAPTYGSPVTRTKTPNPPTVTATFTLVQTITPTAVPPITDLTAWEKSEGDRIAKEAGFTSYAEYVQKKLVENPAYDTEGMVGGD